MEIRQFDIIRVNLDGGRGSEQGKERPCIVIQNDMGNKYSPTTIVIPITHIIKNMHLPTHTLLNKENATGININSMVCGEQLRIIDKSRIINKLGQVTSERAKREIVKVYLANLTGQKNNQDILCA